jgi:hypothetical protein
MIDFEKMKPILKKKTLKKPRRKKAYNTSFDYKAILKEIK